MNNISWSEKNERSVTTLKEAIRLSLLKWKYIVKSNGDDSELLDKYPELKKLSASCGLCELCKKEHDNCTYKENDKTYKCPLIINGQECATEYCDEINIHPWSIWHNSRTKKNAQLILNLIKKIEL